MNRTKFLAFLLCLACLMGVLAPARAGGVSQSGVFDYALVSGTDQLNLRAGPGTEYQWIGAVAAGNWVGITGESGNWYQVHLPETGLSGYMSKNFLKRSGDSSAGTTGVVNNPKASQFLNLRAYPGYDAPVLGIYYNGAVFQLLSSTGDGWYQVQINGAVGYFRSEFVRLNGSGGGQIAYVTSPNTGKVNLRSAPTFFGSLIVGQFPAGTQAVVLLSAPQASSFWKVQINGLTGYMNSAYLTGGSPYAPPAPAPGGKPATRGTAVVNNPKANQHLNLRAQPSTSAKVVAQYTNGTRFQVIQAGETWTKVYGSATGNIGYFMTKYLKLSGAAYNKTVQNGNSYVNLRSSPSKSTGKVLSQVPSGAAVTVLIPGDEWTRVRYGGTVGYMMTSFLK